GEPPRILVVLATPAAPAQTPAPRAPAKIAASWRSSADRSSRIARAAPAQQKQRVVHLRDDDKIQAGTVCPKALAVAEVADDQRRGRRSVAGRGHVAPVWVVGHVADDHQAERRIHIAQHIIATEKVAGVVAIGYVADRAGGGQQRPELRGAALVQR